MNRSGGGGRDDPPNKDGSTLEAPPIRSEMNTHGIEKCDQKVHEKSGPKFNRNLNHIREITNMKEQAKSLQNTVQDEIHSQQHDKPLKQPQQIHQHDDQITS